MSTFDGNVTEFPDIRIDRFTRKESLRPPLALFLSHVHTDHLVGLETCRSPFIYCSSGTREILLRLEKYPHRMNFAKGILESRKQTYKALGKLLKPIPLETPTTLELAPGRSIRVTLFDANHCVGAVMFLIEDENKAVLYTGDIRSELWWVNSLIRNPLLLPYVAGKDEPPLKRLDSIYLDTTFASKDDPYRQFPTKASGIMELLREVARYPTDTLFYFDAWTFGYEEVWQALSSFLGSQIHLDDYRYGLYKSLLNSDDMRAPEAFKLIGAKCGNHIQEGSLSTQQHRIHSCEKGTGCSIWNKNFVRITPVISRYNGMDMPELGAGGGQGDLNQHHALDIDNEAVVSAMMQICAMKLPDQPKLLGSIEQMLNNAMVEPSSTLVLDAADLSQSGDVFDDLDGLPLDSIPAALAKRVARLKQQARGPIHSTSSTLQGLPKQITFPYSRHSSFSELCDLVEAFLPKDIFPCTVEDQWKPTQSTGYLFGHLYVQPPVFRHDQFMLRRANVIEREDPRPASRNRYSQDTQEFEDSTSRGRSRRVSPPQASRRRSTQDANRDDEDRDAKRKKVAQGDYWPPRERHHYSRPLRSTSDEEGIKERQDDDALRMVSAQNKSWHNKDDARYSPPRHSRRSSSHRRKSSVDQFRTDRNNDRKALNKEWTQTYLNLRERSSPTKQINSWRKHIAEAQRKSSSGASSGEDPFTSHKLTEPRRASRTSLRGYSSVRESSQVQPEVYGRLSPFTPPAVEVEAEARRVDDATGHPDALSITSEVKIELDEAEREAELKLALRHEAYHAALGEGELKWSEIGLVSVNGHQEKEEEL